MNRSLGSVASVVIAIATVAFAISMLIGAAPLSWATSMILSWGYVVLASSLAAEAADSRKAAAYSGLAFAVIYAGYVSAVYFVQLTTVLQNAATADILMQLSYAQHGSLMFNLDLLGYGMMAASTFFIGLSMVAASTPDRVLRVFLMLHGVFAPACVLLPIFNVFGSMGGASGDVIGVAVLLVWCVYFFPIAVLAFRHFRMGRLQARP
ncbi:MAG: hypothetical protein WDM94_14795 [Bauldia sp.]